MPPQVGWRTSTRLPRDYYVRLDSNDYSIHPSVIGRRIEVHADLTRVWATCDGKLVHVVGIPLHWGFVGAAKKGWGPNSLTPFVGDGNTQTPEFKSFLVNVEKA